MKKFLIALVVLISIAAIVFFIINNGHKPPRFKTVPITKGNIIQTVTASGTVNPVVNISIGTQTSGTIQTLYADYNSPVKKGQLLAQIDPSLAQTQVEQSKANWISAKANLAKIISVAENDKKTYERDKVLVKSNFIAKSELDLAESTYKSDLAQIEAAKAQIAQAKAALNNSLTNLRYTKILSPVDGIVVSRSVEIGQTVAASFQTPTLFTVAQDLTKMQIDTNVAEADIGKVQKGQRITFTVDGYPDLTFSGKVKQIRNAATTVSNVVTYDVVINVDNKELKLKPGMTANVSIITAEKKNIFIVPNAALRFVPDSNGDTPLYQTHGIWLLQDDGEPKRLSIETGVSDGNYTEVIGKNIREGQKVIIDSIDKKIQTNDSRPLRGMRGF